MTDIVDEDLASAAGWRRASVAPATSAKSAAAAIATSRRPALVASAGRWSGKARFGLAVLMFRLSVPSKTKKELVRRLKRQCLECRPGFWKLTSRT